MIATLPKMAKKQWVEGSYTSGPYNVRDRANGDILRCEIREIPADVVDETTGKILNRERLAEIYSQPAPQFTPRVKNVEEMRALLAYLFGATREDWWGRRFELVEASS